MVNGLLTRTTLDLTASAFRAPESFNAAPSMMKTLHPNLNGLVELARRDGVDIRPTLLRVMTDLYVQKPSHSEQEETHFTELALRLIDLVDASTRAIVANKISGYSNAPAAVRHRLLKDMITLTDPVEPAAAHVTTAPAPAEELSALFLVADAEERRLILLNLPYAPLTPAASISPAVAHEATHRLEAAALGHNTELFARELERTLSISRNLARRLIEDSSGEPAVVVAAALGMPASVLQRILLCLNPIIGQSVQRVYELALLHEEIGTDAALRLVAIWQASHKTEMKSASLRPTPAHQPQYWPDEKDKRSSPLARPNIRWDEYIQTRKAGIA